MAKYDKMKFITLFNKLQYDKPIDEDNIEYESFADYLIDDIDLLKLSPERFNYYKELVSIFNKNPQILYNILKKFYRHKDVKKNEAKYLKQLAYYTEDKSKNSNSLSVASPPSQHRPRSKEENINDIVQEFEPNEIQALTTLFSSNTDKNAIGVQGGGDYNEYEFRDILKSKYDLNNISKLNKNIYSDEKSSENDYYKINSKQKLQNINNKIDNFFKEGKSDIHKIKNDINKFNNDPLNPINELEITYDDRLVFIILTFLIRYISLSIIKWCIDINIIKTFSDGFLYYAIIYLSIFWFIVFFVNIENNIQVDYMNFDNFMNSIRSVLYYYYMGTNGISRLLVHSSLILVLLIIPIILNIRNKKSYDYEDEYNDENELIDYEERNKLNKSLSTFTIYIWILTSIIATKY